jgi:hypothetical protein
LSVILSKNYGYLLSKTVNYFSEDGAFWDLNYHIFL